MEGFPALLRMTHVAEMTQAADWHVTDFEPTHIGGMWASREYWRPVTDAIRLMIHQELKSAIGDDRFAYKPVGLRSEISDLFVRIEDRDGPEWRGTIGFDFYIQGYRNDHYSSLRGDFLKDAFKMTAITPNSLWWDNYNGAKGCTFQPGAFHTARFAWRVMEKELVARGFPTRSLADLWRQNGWLTSSYWSRQVRPTSALVRQTV